MTDLHSLLDVASRPATADDWDSTHDLAEDLRLGRRALTRRRIAAAGGGVAAAGLVVGTLVGGAALLGPTVEVRPAGPSTMASADAAVTATPSTSPSESASSEPTVKLTDRPAQAGPFRYGKTPAGWVAGASGPYAGNLVPVAGGVSDDETNFVGKITAMVQERATAGGTSSVTGQGWTVERPITVGGTVKTLVVQVPESVHLSPDDIDAFVAAITVGPGVLSAVG